MRGRDGKATTVLVGLAAAGVMVCTGIAVFVMQTTRVEAQRAERQRLEEALLTAEVDGDLQGTPAEDDEPREVEAPRSPEAPERSKTPLAERQQEPQERAQAEPPPSGDRAAIVDEGDDEGDDNAAAPADASPSGSTWTLRWFDSPADEPAPPALLVAPSGELPTTPVRWDAGAFAMKDLAPPVAPAEGQEVVFVRFARMELGGDFDNVGKEEVVLRATYAGRTFDLLENGWFDLPDEELEVYALERAPFLALPAAETHALELAAWDEDVTEDELISRAVGPLAVRVADLPLEQEVVVEQPGSEIVYSQFRLFGGNREVRVPGASFALAFVRARVRGPDEASRWGLRRHLGFLLTTPAPDTLDAASRAALEVPGAVRRARFAVACSTHTHLRAAGPRVIDALSDATFVLGSLARLEAPRPSDARAAAAAAADGLDARLAPDDAARPLIEHLRALAGSNGAADPREALRAARSLLPEGIERDFPPPPPGEKARFALLRPAATALDGIDRAARARDEWARGRARVTRAWAAAREALDAALR